MGASGARQGHPAGAGDGRTRRRNAIAFCCVAAAWLLVDQLAKLWAETGPLAAGSALPLLPGVAQLALVHNTGGAWGLLGSMTVPLGVVSVAVCALIAAYLFWLAPEATLGEAVGLALVFAGGLGNAIDRFCRGYVVDLIDPTFVDFPVFNIADIGVTCGIVVFFVAWALRARRERDGSAS